MQTNQRMDIWMIRKFPDSVNIFLQTGLKFFCTVTVGDFKSNAGIQTKFLSGFCQQRQRPFDKTGTAMMVDERCCSGFEAVQQSGFKTGLCGITIQSKIHFPPDFLQNFSKVGRIPFGQRHSHCQRRI